MTPGSESPSGGDRGGGRGHSPYLALKLIWLAGGTLGIQDPSVLEDAGFFGLNLLTFGMDAVALVIVLAFVRPWGGGSRRGWSCSPRGSGSACWPRSSPRSR
nr:hypothetical protein GCM10020093_100600 [Planobispora longispora]